MNVGPEQLPFGFLLNTLGNLVFEQTQRALAGCGVDVVGLGILWLVSLDPGHSQSDYARFQHRDPTTFSRHIDRLEAARLIFRSPVAGDRRAHSLNLTDKGVSVLSSGRAVAAAVEARLTGGYTEQCRHVKRVLAGMLRQDA